MLGVSTFIGIAKINFLPGTGVSGVYEQVAIVEGGALRGVAIEHSESPDLGDYKYASQIEYWPPGSWKSVRPLANPDPLGTLVVVDTAAGGSQRDEADLHQQLTGLCTRSDAWAAAADYIRNRLSDATAVDFDIDKVSQAAFDREQTIAWQEPINGGGGRYTVRRRVRFKFLTRAYS